MFSSVHDMMHVNLQYQRKIPCHHLCWKIDKHEFHVVVVVVIENIHLLDDVDCYCWLLHHFGRADNDEYSVVIIWIGKIVVLVVKLLLWHWKNLVLIYHLVVERSYVA